MATGDVRVLSVADTRKAAETFAEAVRQHASRDRTIEEAFPYDPSDDADVLWKYAQDAADRDAAAMDLIVLPDTIYWTCRVFDDHDWVAMKVSYNAEAREAE